MTPTLTITRDTRPGSSREWLQARLDLVGLTDWDEAKTIRDATVQLLRADGWAVAGSSLGNRHPRLGHEFQGFGIEICGQRGRGPNTAAELHMQSTFTGRD